MSSNDPRIVRDDVLNAAVVYFGDEIIGVVACADGDHPLDVYDSLEEFEAAYE